MLTTLLCVSAIAAEKRVKLFLLRDNTHFDTVGQITLGERMAAEMLKALSAGNKAR